MPGEDVCIIPYPETECCKHKQADFPNLIPYHRILVCVQLLCVDLSVWRNKSLVIRSFSLRCIGRSGVCSIDHKYPDRCCRCTIIRTNCVESANGCCVEVENLCAIRDQTGVSEQRKSITVLTRTRVCFLTIALAVTWRTAFRNEDITRAAVAPAILGQ